MRLLVACLVASVALLPAGLAQSQQTCCCVSRSQCMDEDDDLRSATVGLIADLFGVSPTADGKMCTVIRECPSISLFKPRDSGDDLRIAAFPGDSSSSGSGGGRMCGFDELECCYDSMRELNRAVGPICNRRDGGPGRNGGTGSDFKLGCEETDFVSPVGEPALPFVPRFGLSGREKTCGMREFDPAPGLPFARASPGEFPWTCVVLDSSGKEVAGCAVIPESFDNDIARGTMKVITVAHRVYNQRGPLSVWVGAYDLDDKEDVQTFAVTQVIVHPSFDRNSLRDNIAVLRLSGSIEADGRDGVNAACLPQCDEMFDHAFRNGSGARCWIAGWGKDFQQRVQRIQKKIDVPLMPEEDCNSAIRDELVRLQPGSSKARNFRIDQGEICAGGEFGRDSCEGDGGTPLLCQAPSGRWYAVGLVGYGLECGLDGVPGIYTRIYKYRDFIENAGVPPRIRGGFNFQ